MAIDRIFLTFDDGHGLSCLWAGEYLAKLDISATFFVVPGWIEGGASYHSDGCNPEGLHLSWGDCRYLRGLGHEIGNHTYSHLQLACPDSETVENEYRRGKERIEDQLGAACPTAASPYNDVSAAIVETAVSMHEYGRFGFRTEDLAPFEDSYPVYPSLELDAGVIEKVLKEGPDSLADWSRGGGLIFQIHGFKEPSWNPLAPGVFRGFVSEFEQLLRGESLLEWHRKRV